jgi:hypothetical protein
VSLRALKLPPIGGIHWNLEPGFWSFSSLPPLAPTDTMRDRLSIPGSTEFLEKQNYEIENDGSAGGFDRFPGHRPG